MTDVKTALLAKGRVPAGEVDLPEVGKVHVRGMSRAEILEMRKPHEKLTVEQRMLVLCMVEPALTADEVATWQKVAPSSEIEKVCDKIAELSGAGEGAQKSYVSGA